MSEWLKWIDRQLTTGLTSSEVWQAFIATRPALTRQDEWRTIWQHCFENWSTAKQGPPPMWLPNAVTIDSSNAGRWLKEKGFSDWPSWHRWSVEHRGNFWKEVLQRLKIDFAQEPETVMDLSAGLEHPQWLVGAKYNIAMSCFVGDPNRTAIISGRPGTALRLTTQAQLLDQVRKIGGALRNQGFEPGDRIGVVLPMTADSVAIYLGIIWAGCAVVSIADSFAEPEIASRLRIANARAVFTYDTQTRSGKRLPLYTRVRQATELPIVVVPELDFLSESLRTQDISWEQFCDSSAAIEAHVSGPDTIINILFSSGTTGDPKAIPWTQTTPLKCAIDGYLHQDIHPDHICCWPTNLGWMMGPFLIFASLINRATIALFEDAPVGAAFGRFVQEARVNMLGVIPTIVKSWRSSHCMEGLDWTAIHCFSSTGESSQPDDMFYLSSLAGMRPVIEYCGGTEIGGGYITSTVLQANVPSAFSTAAAGIEFVLLDDNGLPCNLGELFLVPPSIGLSQSLLNRDHHETYFAEVPKVSGFDCLRRHGDFMQQLANGYWVAGGRVDDTMNLGGIKISSAEIERALNEIDGVRETAAIGWSQGGPDELVVFAVCLCPWEPSALQSAMNQQLKSNLNPLFRVSHIRIVESLPRTASNKVMRRELRKTFVPLEPA